MTGLRVFVAIEIPDLIKQAIARQTAQMQKDVGRSVRWVSPENQHITLKFLPALMPDHLDRLKESLQNVCNRQASFYIAVSGLGCFPDMRSPRVIWIGIKPLPALYQLQKQVESVTTLPGCKPEKKPFSAHLTIGRVREYMSVAELRTLQSALQKLTIGDIGMFSVSSITLMKSDLQSSGPIYTPLFSAQLGSQSSG